MSSHWEIGGVHITLVTGPYDDSEMDMAVKARDLPVGLDAGGSMGPFGTVGGFGIRVQEASNAKSVEYWPPVTMNDPDRRGAISSAVRSVLEKAEDMGAERIAFYTLALEVGRVPSWEVAEEIVRELYRHAHTTSTLKEVVLVASSPIQASSFNYVLDNVDILRVREGHVRHGGNDMDAP